MESIRGSTLSGCCASSAPPSKWNLSSELQSIPDPNPNPDPAIDPAIDPNTKYIQILHTPFLSHNCFLLHINCICYCRLPHPYDSAHHSRLYATRQNPWWYIRACTEYQRAHTYCTEWIDIRYQYGHRHPHLHNLSWPPQRLLFLHYQRSCRRCVWRWFVVLSSLWMNSAANRIN